MKCQRRKRTFSLILYEVLADKAKSVGVEVKERLERAITAKTTIRR
jgi:hypothetical protein